MNMQTRLQTKVAANKRPRSKLRGIEPIEINWCVIPHQNSLLNDWRSIWLLDPFENMRNTLNNIVTTMADDISSRIPLPLTVGILLVCVMPFMLTLLGMDFGTRGIPVDHSWALQAPQYEIVDAQFRALSGAFTHTLLEWSAFCVATFVVFLAFSHYRITHDVTTPIIGVAFFMAGCMDAFHTLAADRLFDAVADNRDLIPFTWAISRLFSALIMITGVGIVLLRRQKTKPGFGFVIGVSLVFGVIAYIIIHISATSTQLPQTTYPNAVLTRPYDALPLLLFAFAGLVVFPRLYKRHPSLFAYTLIISAIPEVVTQLHMTFGSTALFDNHFNIAHFLKIVAYIVPLIGLTLDYIRAHQALQLEITERMEAETALKIIETRQRAILETVADAIITIDRKGAIQTFNPAAEKIFGYSTREALGNNVSMLLPEKEQKEHDSYVVNSRLHAPRIFNQDRELQGRRSDGSLFPLELNIAPMELEEEQGFVGVLRDITERKKNERTLQKATEEAKAASQAKSLFLATMSHEIRTPMNAVLGVLGLLKESTLDRQQRQWVHTGRESGELLLTIINDILDFSKMEADKLQLEHTCFDLHRLLTNSTELLRLQAERKGLVLELNPGLGLPRYAKGDPDRLRQILINLTNNAIKFTRDGRINITASADPVNDKTFILHCTVQDTGIGIPQKCQATLFEEFTMADQSHARTHEGTGLGLAICKRLVSLMQGNIGMSSEAGNGSRFFFDVVLESTTEQECGDKLTLEKPQRLPVANRRILLAEDNPANQMVLKNILEFADLWVDIVANGQEAVEAVRNLPYDIVLMDISMPEMDGMTATREIRQLPGPVSKLPIIALTAHSLSGDKERFLEAGMNDYLSKPIDREAMLHCIAHWTDNTTSQKLQTGSVMPQADTSFADTADNRVDLFVDESVLQQLARDTAPETVPGLLTFYIEDARKRVEKIRHAVMKKDTRILEFESHTLGSSAAAHGNAKLYTLARKIEHFCLAGDYQQALSKAALLLPLAEESFRLLAKRADRKFEI
ncbi:MAG: PAS domain S-box protein [Gammaproteobacteria bacterium]|nr:PAS domain S-box protein [Gammaproteobacteria bacterium]